MKTYVKKYTADSIKLNGRIKGDTVYLSLVFSYGFSELVMTPNGTRVVYPKVVVATGTVAAKYWADGDFTDVFMRKHRKEHSALVKSIAEEREKVWRAYIDLTAGEQPKPSPQQIMDKVAGPRHTPILRQSFADYIREYAKTVHGESPLTMAKYMTLAGIYDVMTEARKTEPFNQWAVGSGDITIRSYSEADWQDVTTLVRKVGCRITTGSAKDLVFTGGYYGWNTLEKFQQNTRSVLNYAIRKKIPLKVVASHLPKVSRKDVDHACLSLDQVATLVTAQFDEPELENVRRLFVLQCFTGAAVSDVGQIIDAPIDIYHGRQLTFRSITYVRSKTGVVAVVPVLAPVWDILGGTEPKPYLPKFDQQYNDWLKVVCERLGFDNIVNIVQRKADGTNPIKRASVAELTSTHVGRAIFKYVWEEECRINRDLVCQVMAHTLDTKSADAAYRRMTRERKAELFLLMAQITGDGLPFPVMPPPVVISKVA